MEAAKAQPFTHIDGRFTVTNGNITRDVKNRPHRHALRVRAGTMTDGTCRSQNCRFTLSVCGSSKPKRGAVAKQIAQLNIEFYRQKLATEKDETKRQSLLRLLAEEEAKLAALDEMKRV
jgi:hypothetical protein